MKNIELEIYTNTIIFMTVSVEDDYQINTSNGNEFWKDIIEKSPQLDNKEDLLSGRISDAEGVNIGDLMIVEMDIDYIDSATIYVDNRHIDEVIFKPIPFEQIEDSESATLPF